MEGEDENISPFRKKVAFNFHRMWTSIVENAKVLNAIDSYQMSTLMWKRIKPDREKS